MSQLGITPSNTMSGFLFDTLQGGHSWDEYENGVTGVYFPTHTWNPQFLWGAATPQHAYDPHFFGVYKPAGMGNFFQHVSTNNLTVIGTGCQIKLESTTTVSFVDSLIDNIVADIQSGNLPANGIYTQEIFFSEGKVAQPWFMSLLNGVIDSVNAHVTAGTVEWKNLTEIYNYWQTTYSSTPFAYDCDGNNVLGIDDDIVDLTDQITIYPNPASNYFSIQQNSDEKTEVTIYNSYGQLVFTDNFTKNMSIPVNEFTNGVYFVQFIQNKKSATYKLIKQ